MKEIKLMKRNESASAVFLGIGVAAIFCVLSIADYNKDNIVPVLLILLAGAVSLLGSAICYWPNVFLGYAVSAGCVVIAWIQSKIKHPRKCYLIITLRNNCRSYKEFYKECVAAFDRYVDYLENRE